MILRTAFLVFTAAVSTAVADPQHHWSSRFQSARLRVDAIATDTSGNVVIVGYADNYTNFGNGPVGGAGPDVFAAKFDAFGDLVWARLFKGSVTNQHARSVAIDAGGNVVIVGYYAGTIDFGGGNMAASDRDVFVAKLDANGGHVWSKRFGVASGLSTGNYGEGVAVDAAGNVIVTGSFSVVINFGGGPLTSLGSQDAFLAKFDADGNHVWSQRFGAAGNQYGKAVSVDATGGVVFAGSYQTSMQFGSTNVLSNRNGVFVARVEADGSNTWIRGSGTLLWHPDVSLSVDAVGNVVVGGEFSGSIDLGGGVFTSPLNDWDGYVASLDAAGAHRWSAHLGGAQTQNVRGVAIDMLGNIDVTGTFHGSVNVGGISRDVFVARLDPNGIGQWAQSYGDTGPDEAVGLAVDAAGALLVTGTFDRRIDLGGGLLTGCCTSVYLAKLGEGALGPTLDISLLPRGNAIEARWDISSRWPLDRFVVLRDLNTRTDPTIVAAGPIASGQGVYLDLDVAPGETYRYELIVFTGQGLEYRSPIATATVPLFQTQLAQNVPNPFNPATSIAYSLSERADVALVIFDVSGAVVRRFDEGARDAGEYAIEWDGRDDAGRAVASGVYFYRLDGVRGVAPRKMVLVK